MAPGEEQILHRFPQKGFDALWPTGNAARHGQGNQPMDQAPASFHQIRDVCSLDSLSPGLLLHGLTCQGKALFDLDGRIRMAIAAKGDSC
jgi:hypothetical protein